MEPTSEFESDITYNLLHCYDHLTSRMYDGIDEGHAQLLPSEDNDSDPNEKELVFAYRKFKGKLLASEDNGSDADEKAVVSASQAFETHGKRLMWQATHEKYLHEKDIAEQQAIEALHEEAKEQLTKLELTNQMLANKKRLQYRYKAAESLTCAETEETDVWTRITKLCNFKAKHNSDLSRLRQLYMKLRKGSSCEKH